MTVSPNRARISTIRPEDMETTGTLRETSALTTPVTLNTGLVAWPGGGGNRELLRVLYLHHGAILFMLDLRRGSVLGRRILGRHSSHATRQQNSEQNNQSGRHEDNLLHGITSRPTAKFNWLAELR